MLAVDLPPDIEQRLDLLAQRLGVAPADLVREAILEHMQDLDDAELAAERLMKPVRRWTQTELEQGLDLDG
jgi:RHH-type transcriptional regulator, rel operon repressor / antitoxin RelB